MTAPRRWYLVQAKPRQERTALRNLERQGYEAFLPLLQSERRARGRTVRRVEAMFPRYLFVRLGEAQDDFGPIRSTLGVAQLVRFGALYAHVPDSLVDELRDRCGTEGVAPSAAKPLEPGARVRVLEGPFVGYEGLFAAVRGRDRVSLLLEIASRHVLIELPPGVLGNSEAGHILRRL